MFLKQLDTVGFKSFAERTKIDFVNGVTAVVGPNGSGKSNIIDAVRWVLGEQSAKSLRGQKMEDVIFQGSDSRNALNFAEVTLILNNDENQLPIDFDEVSVTRRVYRSGDSEFYINKQACRLKDIIDLFMDSGLGKEAFTIIGQGKIEEILSSKAEERRAIFEEAAGVLKYKQRKRQAEFKLVETEENLNRIEDIIHEIEQQIEPLRKQAETAKVYQEKSEHLKNIEIGLLVTEITQRHEQWENVLTEIKELKDIEVKIKADISIRETKLLSQKEKLIDIDNTLQNLQKLLLTVTEELEKCEGSRNLLIERLKHYEENKKNLELSILQTNEKKKLTKRVYEEEELKLEQLVKSNQELKEELLEIQEKAKSHGTELTLKIEDLKADYIEYLNEEAVNKNELHSTQKRLEQIQAFKQEESSSQNEKVEKRASLESELNKLKEHIELKESEIYKIDNEIDQKEDKFKIEQTNLNEMREKIHRANEQIATLSSRKETYEEMRDSYQGYFYGVKEVLKAADDKKVANVEGIVLDLISVPSDYITAIDTILGAQSQHVVVKDDQAARESINWLKKENKGRATFLPLASISERHIPEKLLSELQNYSGFINVAANIIQTADKYKKLVYHLMGNALVVKTLKDANEVAKMSGRRYRVVTLEGDVVYPGGSMSGGAKKKTNQSLFTREKDLAILTKKLDDYTERTANFKNTINSKKIEINHLDDEIKTLRVSKYDMNELLSDLALKHTLIENQYNKFNDDLLVYDLNMKQNVEERNHLLSKEKELTIKLKENKMKLLKTNDQINELNTKLTTFNTNEEENKAQLHNLEIKIAESEERIKNQRNTAIRTKNEFKEVLCSNNALKEELKELVKAHANENTEVNMDDQIIIKQKEKDKIEYTLSQTRKSINQLSTAIEDEERDVKEEEKERLKLMSVIQNKEVSANRLDVSLETRITHLQTEYIMSFERANELYEKVTDIETVKQEVTHLKSEITRLGTVNLGAIEEFERIEERYLFLTTQQKDLLDAKQTLYNVISEMDEEMVALFSETFEQIQKEFEVVFKELFGGGYAKLSLTDPNNMLDTGIDIIAQPPGKKLRSLGLLSGGERALTALALLFSILKVRPVPFCILDEVEAALDEANVIRFAKYVKMHSEDIQFIVITHRRGTMEEADVLYGVTMQEPGISRLVSVRLEEADALIT